MPHQFNRDAESRLKILKAISPLNTFSHDEVLQLVAIQENVEPNTLESHWLMQLIVDTPSLVKYNRGQKEYEISDAGKQLLEEIQPTSDLNWVNAVDLWAVTYYQSLMEQFNMPERNDTQELIYARAQKNLVFHQNRINPTS